MSVFVESPWPATMLAMVLLVVCGTIFMRTGRASVLVLMAVAVAILAGGVMLERMIVTDREQVEDTVHAIALDLVANDIPAVMSHFAPSAPRQAEARRVLEDVKVYSASVGNDLEIRINELTTPATATAYFTGRINAKAKRGQTIPYENFFRKFKVTFERHNRRWLIANYEDADPRRKID
jgi:hypothetical protein